MGTAPITVSLVSYRGLQQYNRCMALHRASRTLKSLCHARRWRTSHADLEHWTSSVPVLGLPALGKAGLSGLAVSNATLPICRTPKKFSWYFCWIILAVVPDVLRSRALVRVLRAALSLFLSTLQPFIDPQCATICKCRSPST